MFACLFICLFSVRIGFFLPFDYDVIFFKSKDRVLTFFIKPLDLFLKSKNTVLTFFLTK